MRPIRGTLPPLPRRPGGCPSGVWRLGTDDKFRRENLMIADLIRNDLGRVCIAGSVQVRQLMGVESYRGVHQLVSPIVGTLKPSVSPLDCLRAVLPAGSMTGAPKRRTMQLIEEVEWAPRGLYAGALGWFDVERAEFSVVIRTLQGERDRATLNVGGAIIIGSDAASEMQEAMDKARSVSTSPSLAMGLETSEVSPWCGSAGGEAYPSSPAINH
ncbi:MAG TPA: chorismate-binding protein [Microbacterium sp.]|nr:chorismate-binding protein [Microbacterium sp.]